MIKEVKKSIKYNISKLRGYVSGDIRGLRENPCYSMKSDLVYEKIENFDGEKEVLEELLKRVGKGDVFFDVGANFGLYTVPIGISRKNVKVYSFEPIRDWFKMLKENMCINKVKYANPFMIALGKKVENKKMIRRNIVGSGMASYNYTKNYEKKVGDKSDRVSVRVSTLDALTKSNIVPIPNIIKIDVEGAEYDVVRGGEKTLSSKKCKKVLVEMHKTGSKKMAEKRLKSLGFSIESSWGRSSEVLQMWVKQKL